MMGAVLSAVVGVLAFAILFHAPRRSYGVCALCGGLTWWLYLLVTEAGGSTFMGAAVSVLALTMLSRILSVAMELPGTVFVIPGVFPIVPGAGIYYTAYGLITQDMVQFQQSGMDCLYLAGGIAIGMLLGMGAPEKPLKALGRGLGRILPGCLRRKA